MQNGKFIPEKSNIWRDACDGYLDWCVAPGCGAGVAAACVVHTLGPCQHHDELLCCRVKEHVYEGAPLNEADHCGDPPLILAAGGGHLACVQLLLAEGADIEQRNVTRETPLIRAAHNGHLAVVKYLLAQGAEVNALDMVRCGTSSCVNVAAPACAHHVAHLLSTNTHPTSYHRATTWRCTGRPCGATWRLCVRCVPTPVLTAPHAMVRVARRLICARRSGAMPGATPRLRWRLRETLKFAQRCTADPLAYPANEKGRCVAL